MRPDSRYSIEITSPPDRDQPVAEVWYGPNMIAEINQESPELAVQFYPTDAILNLNTLLETLQWDARHLRGEPTDS